MSKTDSIAIFLKIFFSGREGTLAGAAARWQPWREARKRHPGGTVVFQILRVMVRHMSLMDA
jgi:hypothetical protein